MENKLEDMLEAQRTETVKQWVTRYNYSRNHFQEQFSKMERMLRIYEALGDADVEEDEYNIALAYAFGLVEKTTSKITNAMLRRLAINVHPRSADPKHEDAADKFYDFCSAYYRGDKYVGDYIPSVRAMCITGIRWEFDDWTRRTSKGKRWAEVETTQESTQELPTGETQSVSVPYKKLEEVDHEFVEKDGYECRFPTAFNVFPQPGVTRLEDMGWIIEQEPCVELEELRKQTVLGPDGEERPLYDLSEIDRDYPKGHKLGSLKPVSPNSEDNSPTQSEDGGVDAVHILRGFTRTGLYVVANGKYLILAAEGIYHRPGLPCRRVGLVEMNDRFYPKGLLEPIEAELCELNDVHNLSMQQWERIINRMILIAEGALVDPGDLKPRAGGIVRVKVDAFGNNVNSVAREISHQDVSGSMLTLESNAKGLIEWASPVTDMSPGVDGTKQYHDTASGLAEIQADSNQKMGLIYFAENRNRMRQMESLYWLAEQHLFDAVAMPVRNAQGQEEISEFSREAFDTDGKGFIFTISDDPSFGDTNVQKAQALAELQQCMAWETWRRQIGDSSFPKAEAGESLRRYFEVNGRMDTSKLLTYETAGMKPEQALEALVQGQDVQPTPDMDIAAHLRYFVAQRPAVQQAAASGQASPDIAARVDGYINALRQLMVEMAQNPAQFAAQSAPVAPGQPNPNDKAMGARI